MLRTSSKTKLLPLTSVGRQASSFSRSLSEAGSVSGKSSAITIDKSFYGSSAKKVRTEGLTDTLDLAFVASIKFTETTGLDYSAIMFPAASLVK